MKSNVTKQAAVSITLLGSIFMAEGAVMQSTTAAAKNDKVFTVRKADERGAADFGWLQSRHSFSFGQYYDPAHMGFRSLRVINDDHVAPGMGFGTHPHDNMEIISYAVAGAMEHKDSMGTGSVIRPGDLQRMTAGTGVTHSEFNHSETEEVHFLQIWILPERQGLEPGYEQKHFPEEERRGVLRLVGSRDGREGSITIHQDVNLYAGLFDRGESDRLELPEGRHLWIQVIRGSVLANGQLLETGDGASASNLRSLDITGQQDAEILVFDLG